MFKPTRFKVAHFWKTALFFSSSFFLLAWWSFNYPLTYCDSTSWAPHYFEQLTGRFPLYATWQRGLTPVVGFYFIAGRVATWLQCGNFIGGVQAVMLCFAAGMMSYQWMRGGCAVDFLLMPGLLLCYLRLSIYSQTILSEPLVVFLSLMVAYYGLKKRRGPVGLIFAAVISSILFQSKIDSLGIILVIPLGIVVYNDTWNRRIAGLSLFFFVFIAAGVAVKSINDTAAHSDPVAGLLIASEWARYTRPPQNRLAEILHFDGIDRVINAGAGGQTSTIFEGLNVIRTLGEPGQEIGWATVFRFIVYQTANNFRVVALDRLKALHDFYFTGAAAFDPGFRGLSNLYWPHRELFARWSVEELAESRYSCPHFAHGLAEAYQVPGVRSVLAVSILLELNSLASHYAHYLFMPLCQLAVPLGLLCFFRKGFRSQYGLLSAVVFINLLERAVLIAVDERYQLPLDLLVFWWMVLTLRYQACWIYRTLVERRPCRK